MKTIEKNKLIAEFMGYVNTTPTDKDFDIYHNERGMVIDNKIHTMIEPTSTKFHSSWDWLFPVLVKCHTVVTPVDPINHYYLLNDALLLLEIEPVYEAVINFIEWYNQNKEQ